MKVQLNHDVDTTEGTKKAGDFIEGPEAYLLCQTTKHGFTPGSRQAVEKGEPMAIAEPVDSEAKEKHAAWQQSQGAWNDVAAKRREEVRQKKQARADAALAAHRQQIEEALKS